MKYLIDTHTMLWFLFDNEKISQTATETIISNKGFIFASIASLWEIAIKIHINKLDIKYHPNDLLEFCRKESIGILNITPQHVNETLTLPRSIRPNAHRTGQSRRHDSRDVRPIYPTISD